LKTLARQSDKDELVARLRGLRPDSVRRWGRMSAHQAVCHASDCLRMAMGQRPVSPSTDLFQRTVVKWVALYSPLRWPPGIQTRPEIDQQGGGTRPVDFAADVAELEALLERMRAPATRLDRSLHPMFGRMSNTDWLRWGYLHTDHHLRQFGA
jgi:hypothetical protein